MKYLFMLSWFLVSCDYWQPDEISVNIPSEYSICEHLNSLPERDSITWSYNYVSNKNSLCNKTNWPTANCTLQVNVLYKNTSCKQSKIFWNSLNQNWNFESFVNPLSLWLPIESLHVHIANVNQNNLQNYATLKEWWRLDLNENDYKIIQENLVQSIINDDLDIQFAFDQSFSPWNRDSIENISYSLISKNIITREDLLSWKFRKASVFKVDSIVTSTAFTDTNDWISVGACPNQKSFYVLNKGLTFNDCKDMVPLKYFDYFTAKFCAQQLNAKLPTYGQLQCIMGLWNDTISLNKTSILKWRKMDSLFSQKLWLADTTQQNTSLIYNPHALAKHPLDELKLFATDSLATLILIDN